MRTILVAALALVLLTPYATANECDHEVVVGANGAYFSVDNDLCQPDCFFSIWVYSDDDPDPCNPEDPNPIIF